MRKMLRHAWKIKSLANKNIAVKNWNRPEKVKTRYLKKMRQYLDKNWNLKTSGKNTISSKISVFKNQVEQFIGTKKIDL